MDRKQDLDPLDYKILEILFELISNFSFFRQLKNCLESKFPLYFVNLKNKT